MSSSAPLRWGILGTGNIARKFADQLRRTASASLAAVGSRQLDSARAFTAEFGGMAWGSYEQLVQDRGVDAVYISLPNALHHEWTLRCLEAGKHVLCEKPIAANAAQAQEMFDVAQRHGRLLIEAFMYRCHPAVQHVIEMVRGGSIGSVRLIRSNFTFNRPQRPDDVRYQSGLAGGSLMDVGCYCVNFTRALAGEEPAAMHALGHAHHFGVDDYAGGVVKFPGGTIGVFTCGMNVISDRATFIGGSEGYIAFDTPWFTDGRFVVVRGEAKEEMHIPATLPPYALEAQMFAECAAGRRDPWITPADSLGNMRVLDELRRNLL